MMGHHDDEASAFSALYSRRMPLSMPWVHDSMLQIISLVAGVWDCYLMQDFRNTEKSSQREKNKRNVEKKK